MGCVPGPRSLVGGGYVQRCWVYQREVSIPELDGYTRGVKIEYLYPSTRAHGTWDTPPSHTGHHNNFGWKASTTHPPECCLVIENYLKNHRMTVTLKGALEICKPALQELNGILQK